MVSQISELPVEMHTLEQKTKTKIRFTKVKKSNQNWMYLISWFFFLLLLFADLKGQLMNEIDRLSHDHKAKEVNPLEKSGIIKIKQYATVCRKKDENKIRSKCNEEKKKPWGTK